MGRIVRDLTKNGILFGSKTALLLILAMVLNFSGGCSRKMPCPEVTKATAKAKKQKKNKVVKTKAVATDGADDGGGADNAIASASEEPTETEVKKPNLSGSKNKYNKNGLLQKKKYKQLRNNASKKTARSKGNFFSRLFSGGKTKTKTKRKPNVEPVAE